MRFFLEGRSVRVARCSLQFTILGMNPDFGRKPIVDSFGCGLYPELAILRLLQKDGFRGVWVDAFRGNKFWTTMSKQRALPAQVQRTLDKIATRNHSNRGGCWDVVAWKPGKLIFVESKGPVDKIRDSQRFWLEAALYARVPLSCFVVCEWRYANKRFTKQP